MERVMIIGCGGAGKSTLARKLGEKTGLPVVHLDQIWWSPGNWQHMERPEFEKLLLEEMEKPRWILDGNFRRTLEMRLQKCDTVIYLDFPGPVCLKNWLGRVIKNWGHARSDMAEGCAERFDPEFARWILSFNKNYRTHFYELLNHAQGKQVIILRSRREVEKFLSGLKKN